MKTLYERDATSLYNSQTITHLQQLMGEAFRKGNVLFSDALGEAFRYILKFIKGTNENNST